MPWATCRRTFPRPCTFAPCTIGEGIEVFLLIFFLLESSRNIGGRSWQYDQGVATSVQKGLRANIPQHGLKNFIPRLPFWRRFLKPLNAWKSSNTACLPFQLEFKPNRGIHVLRGIMSTSSGQDCKETKWQNIRLSSYFRSEFHFREET